MTDRERYITLSDTIIDREKVSAVYRDAEDAAKLFVLFDNGTIHHFNGGDAVQLWREFSDEKTWRDE